MGSFMAMSFKTMVACGCVAAIALATLACSPRRIPAVTIAGLMEDRVALDGVLMKCNRDPLKARGDSDCVNARIAIERLAAQVDPAVDAKRLEDFERRREQLRLSEERKRRQEQESKANVDAYHLPVIPVESTPLAKEAPPPTVSGTNP
jgi:hypothetical protein